jgi:hypothetical protein
MDWEEVMEQLSDNAKLVPSKRGGWGATSGSGFKVSKGNESKHFNKEAKAVQKWEDKRRKSDQLVRSNRKARELASDKTNTIGSFFAPVAKSSLAVMDGMILDEMVFDYGGGSAPPALLPQEDTIDIADNAIGLVDDALAEGDPELDAAVRDAVCVVCAESGTSAPGIRQRLHAHMDNMKTTKNPEGYLKANAYAKYEEHVRSGKSDLQAGRLVAEQFYVRERKARVNASTNEHNQKYWYRHRSRAIIIGYRFFKATGQILPERRGACKGKSHIHDPDVQRWCRTIIGGLGKTWSARTFRDKVSAKLRDAGMVKPGRKIGRSTATYYLHALNMTLECPKKGIYKDGHERVDTVEDRGVYTALLMSFRDRERTYRGDRLDIEVSPVNQSLAEAIRVYHDECIYASHEGAIQLWVEEGQQAMYKKPRGQILMTSGFICRCHGMMVIPDDEKGPFLRWMAEDEQLGGETGSFGLRKIITEEEHFPMSSKVYKNDHGSGSLCSFTTIVPGKAKGKDDYWVNRDVCEHLAEVSWIFKWVHRRHESVPPPEMHAIFDGSSNHGARAPDGLRVGSGICKKPGGLHAPGSSGAHGVPAVPKMRDGWYTNEAGEKVVQQMHRDKLWMDDNGNKGAQFYNKEDGSIFKGVEEILREGGDACLDEHKEAMVMTCSKARRTQMKCPTDTQCQKNRRCCLTNALRWRPDFAEQKCELEEVCERHGVKFIMLMMCHPECNPIECATPAHHPPVILRHSPPRTIGLGEAIA